MADDAEIVKLFYELGNSPITVQRRLSILYPNAQLPSRKQIRRLVNKFKLYGTVKDRRHANNGRPRSARSAENVTAVRDVIDETPRHSVRKVFADISNTTSKTTVHRMLKFDLKLTPYKITVMQHLKERDIDSRLAFADWVFRNDRLLDTIWFSDKAHFASHGHVNKQNVRFWGTEKPEFHDEKPLHSEKITVRAEFSSNGVIGPFYEEAGVTTTVTSERYLRILRSKFLPELTKRGITPDSCIFQQDGAAPHTARVVLSWLAETFGGNLISLKTETEWPAHSPDLSPLDFFLWGYLKDKIYTPQPTTINELKRCIRREMKKISQDTCRNVIENFRRRIKLVKQKKGGHIEHVL